MSLSPEININEVSGGVTGFKLNISFKEPTITEKRQGIVSIDQLFDYLNEGLIEVDQTIWVLIDRLDVAFIENLELETNALRALFKTYNDLKAYARIKLKIFLRDDIWKRITEQGFREASHITKTITISWSKPSLLNLIIYRLLDNESIVKAYNVDKADILGNYDKQEELFFRLFPDQIDQGAKRLDSLDWIVSRVKDGKGVSTPREIIHLLKQALLEQITRLERGEQDLEGDKLIGGIAFKAALDDVSRVRLEQTIFAEYPSYKNYIMSLQGGKANHSIESLRATWKTNLVEAAIIVDKLTQIGFFEPRKDANNSQRYWIPFMYRNYLSITQGSAD